MQKKIFLFLIAAVLAFAFGACGDQSARPVFSQDSSSRDISAVSLENYDKIHEGMTLEEVESILGKGSLSANIGEASVFSWPGAGLSSISVTFENNAVSDKAQIGLGEQPAAVPVASPASLLTRENIDKVTVGMTLEEVEALIGKGTKLVTGDKAVSYLWQANSKKPISVTVVFRENKVVSVFSAGL